MPYLALLNGGPAFAEPLYVGRPNVGDRGRFLARVNEMLDRRWLTNDGPLVQEFEQKLADFLDVKHVVAMCNATIGLEIATRAAGLRGEVIVPSFTFIATAHALQWQEITPVFCDIDPATHTLDPRRVEALITPRTTGIIGVHLWGRACAVDELAEIAARRRLTLIFDAAHAFGCTRRGKPLGGNGLCEVFSFHATKFFNTFEGGAVATDDDSLADKMRLMRNFGFAGFDHVIYIGTNGKMAEVNAAMGLTNLESLDEFMKHNRANYQAYRQGLAGLPGLKLLDYDDMEQNNYQYIVVEVDEARAGLCRDELVAVLHAENVIARRYFHPGCHRMEPYRSYQPHAGLLLPETERLASRVLLLPTGTGVEVPQAERVVAIIRQAMERTQDVRARLHAVQADRPPLLDGNGAPLQPASCAE